MAKKSSSVIRATREDRAWRARDDLRTLQQAKEIQADRSRIVAATREAQNQIKALHTVARVPLSRTKC